MRGGHAAPVEPSRAHPRSRPTTASAHSHRGRQPAQQQLDQTQANESDAEEDGLYFTPASARSHFPPADTPAMPAAASSTPSAAVPAGPLSMRALDPTSLQLGQEVKYAAPPNTLRGNALKARFDGARIRAGGGKMHSHPPQRPASAGSHGPSLTGLPVSFFGVSRDLTKGQAQIQRGWMGSMGIGEGGQAGDKSARSKPPRPASAMTASQSVAIPSLNLPIDAWQSEQSSAQSLPHSHSPLPMQQFELPLSAQPAPPSYPAPPAPAPPQAAQPASAFTARPASSSTTSRSQRAQQAASVGITRPFSARTAGASKARPLTAGASRASSVRPITASQVGQHHNPTFQPMTSGVNLVVDNKGKGEGAYQTVKGSQTARPASGNRPSSAATHQPKAESVTPSNLYPHPPSSKPHVYEEKTHSGEPSSDAEEEEELPFEAEYQRWAQRQRQQRPIPGSHTSRPASSASSSFSRPTSSVSSRSSYRAVRSARPASGSHSARGSLFDPLRSFTPASANSRLSSSSRVLSHYDPSAFVHVEDDPTTKHQYADRQAGLLATTRARPPFSAGSTRGEASMQHSSEPSMPAALKPNAGFQTELRVSHDALRAFIDRCTEERAHFYSPTLFWEYKFKEMMKATEAEASPQTRGATARVGAEEEEEEAEEDEGSGGEEGQAGAKNAHSHPPKSSFAPTNDHVYPNTYRLLATSYILQQVLPTLHPQPSPSSSSTDGAPSSASHQLVPTLLDLLHRSLYQPSGSVVPPPLPPHLIDSDLTECADWDLSDEAFVSGQPPLSKRGRELSEVRGSGYGQSEVRGSGHGPSPTYLVATHSDGVLAHMDRRAHEDLSTPQAFASSLRQALSEEGKLQLLQSNPSLYSNRHDTGAAITTSDPLLAVPYSLTLKYLYERSQLLQLENDKVRAKIARVELAIDTHLTKFHRRTLQLSFEAWRDHVRFHRLQRALRTRLDQRRVLRVARSDPHLMFRLWKDHTQRNKEYRIYKHTLRSIKGRVKGVGEHVRNKGHRDQAAILQRVESIQEALETLEQERRFHPTPIDLFTPLSLQLLLSRYSGSLDLISSLSYVPLYPLSAHYVKSLDASVEVDMLLSELTRVDASALQEVKIHLLSRVQGLVLKEGQREETMMEELVQHQTPEQFLLGWMNMHLAAVNERAIHLKDLVHIPVQMELYTSLLTSIAPDLIQPALKRLREEEAVTSGTRSTMEQAEIHVLNLARIIMGVCRQLGCLSVMALEEFVAHPAHGPHLARLAKEKAKQMARGGAGGAGNGGPSRKKDTEDDSAPFDPLSTDLFSTHPADAGLSPRDLGWELDAQGRPVHGRAHMFDEVAKEEGEKQSKHKQKTNGASGNTSPTSASSSSAQGHPQDSDAIPSNPHLHLCLIATLFLQRPALPAAALPPTAVQKEEWMAATRTRLEQMHQEYVSLTHRRDVSPLEAARWIDDVKQVGVEIECMRVRAQRRSDHASQAKQRVEGLLWQLQRRSKTATGVPMVIMATDTMSASPSSSLSYPSNNLSGESLRYNEIPLGKLLDVLVSKEATALKEYEAICTTLGQHYAELANVFRHYAAAQTDMAGRDGSDKGWLSAASGGSGLMHFDQFLLLMSDCQLTSPSSTNSRLNSGVLHVIFTRCSRNIKQLVDQSNHAMPLTDADRLEQSGMGRKQEEDEEADPSDPSRPSSSTSPPSSSLILTQAGFFESLIRISVLQYPTLHSLSARLHRLIEVDLLPRACTTKQDEFRAMLNRDRVRHVLSAHRVELMAIFAHFAKSDEAENKKGNTGGTPAKSNKGAGKLQREGFLRMAQEANFLGPSAPILSTAAVHGVQFASSLPLDESTLLHIWKKTLRSPTGSTPVEHELQSFPEFLESICAIAATVYPDPYLPIQVKLEMMISGYLVPPLRKAIRKLHYLANVVTPAVGANVASSSSSAAASHTLNSSTLPRSLSASTAPSTQSSRKNSMMMPGSGRVR